MLRIKYDQYRAPSTQYFHADLNCRLVIAQLVVRQSGEFSLPLFPISLLTYLSYNCGGELATFQYGKAHETDNKTQL